MSTLHGSAEWNGEKMTGEMFFEDYVTGATRETIGRTITERMLCCTPDRPWTFILITWMRSGVRRSHLDNEWLMGR
jgi:hypothetical protein